MDISKFKKGLTFLLPFLPDIWGFFRDKEHDKKFERVEKTIEKITNDPDLKKWFVDVTTYEDENLYWEALFELNPDSRQLVRDLMTRLAKERGNKTRDNVMWAISCLSENQSRINRLKEFVSCKNYQEFDDMLVADGMLTPTNDTSNDAAKSFKEKWTDITEYLNNNWDKIEKKWDVVKKDFETTELTGPFSGWANRMIERNKKIKLEKAERRS